MQPTYQAIHQAVVDLTHNHLQVSSSYLAIEQLVAQGAPLNPTQAGERSLIIPLVLAFKNHGERVYNHMQLLIQAGANPMLEGVFNPGFVDVDEETADYLLCAMVRAEAAGKPMRDEQGENPLHVLMRAGEWESADNSPEWMAARYHPHWVNGARSDGATPLHVLWAGLCQHLDSHGQVDSNATWKETRALVQMGARLGQSEAGEGTSVAQMILHAVARGIEVPARYQFLVEQARAAHEADELSASTAGASRPTPTRRI